MTVDETGVDKTAVDKTGVDKLGINHFHIAGIESPLSKKPQHSTHIRESIRH